MPLAHLIAELKEEFGATRKGKQASTATTTGSNSIRPGTSTT